MYVHSEMQRAANILSDVAFGVNECRARKQGKVYNTLKISSKELVSERNRYVPSCMISNVLNVNYCGKVGGDE